MARVHARLLGQRGELLQARPERRRTSAGKVGASAAADEERVAGAHATVEDVGDAGERVSGCRDRAHRGGADVKELASVERDERRGDVAQLLLHARELAASHVDPRAGELHDVGDTVDVIGVRVRDEHGFDAHLVRVRFA